MLASKGLRKPFLVFAGKMSPRLRASLWDDVGWKQRQGLSNFSNGTKTIMSRVLIYFLNNFLAKESYENGKSKKRQISFSESFTNNVLNKQNFLGKSFIKKLLTK